MTDHDFIVMGSGATGLAPAIILKLTRESDAAG